MSKEDFSSELKESSGGRPCVEYMTNDKIIGRQILKEFSISVDMAKELAMVQFGRDFFKPNLSLNDLEIFDVINL